MFESRRIANTSSIVHKSDYINKKYDFAIEQCFVFFPCNVKNFAIAIRVAFCACVLQLQLQHAKALQLSVYLFSSLSLSLH